MNQTFSLHRLGLLIAKHWAENKKRYLLSVLAFVGLFIAWFLFVLLTDPHKPMAEGLQQVTYFFSLFAVGTLYASQQFSDLGSKAKATNYLLVPASHLEKLLCALFYTVLVFFVAFTTAFYSADAVMVFAANAVAALPSETSPVTNVFSAADIGLDWNRNIYLLLIFFALQSAFLLGSIYFSNYSFIKTSIALAILFFAFFTLFYLYSEALLPDGGYSHGFLTSYRVSDGMGESKLVQLPGWIGDALRFLFLYAITPLLWLTTYHRLKEKEF